MQIDRSLLAPAIFGGLLAVGLIGSGLAIGSGIINAQVGNRQVTVRGLSEKDVVADLAVLNLHFSAAGDDLDVLKSRIDGDLVKVRAFLKSQGYPDAAVTVGRLEVTDLKAQAYQPQPDLPHYRVGQGVTVRTAEVDRVARTDRALDQLVRQDVLLDFSAPTYVFTRLNEVRPAMIAEATASARTGAEQFAQDSGAPLGPIRQATQGSFEILARQDIDEESTSLEKRVRVVATVTYQLK